MEWLIIGLFAVFGYVQTDRLADSKAEAEKWQSVAQSNYNEAIKAKEANDTLAITVTDLEESGAECSQQLGEALDSIHNYRESDRIRRTAVGELERKLEQSGDSHNNPECRVPEWVFIEGLTARYD